MSVCVRFHLLVAVFPVSMVTDPILLVASSCGPNYKYEGVNSERMLIKTTITARRAKNKRDVLISSALTPLKDLNDGAVAGCQETCRASV